MRRDRSRSRKRARATSHTSGSNRARRRYAVHRRRQTGRGEELAALAAPHAPAALPGVVLDTRQNSDLGQHLTLVVDDADFTLDIPPLTSPTEVS